MGRTAKITEDIKDVIFKILWDDSTVPIAKIHREIEIYLLEKETEKILKGKGIRRENLRDDDLGEIFENIYDENGSLPDESTVDRHVRDKNLREMIRERKPKSHTDGNEIINLQSKPDFEEKDIPRDIPWSIAACRPPYNIPTEMIPMLIEYKRIYLEQMEFNQTDNDLFPDELTYQEASFDNPLRKLTVRKSEWMSRLYPAACKFIKEHVEYAKFDEHLFSLLSDLADVYVASEIKNEVLGRNVYNSVDIDKIIFGKKYSCFENIIWAIQEAWLKMSTNYTEDSEEWTSYINLIRENQDKNDKKYSDKKVKK
jgi:hypothetical protein